MIVECIENSFNRIDKNIYFEIEGYSSSTILPIDIGQKSIVYAISTINRCLWYLIDVEGLRYPMYYPKDCFKIIDGNISKYWSIKESIDYYSGNKLGIEIGFEEMINDEYFYGEMLEDNARNLEIFEKYRSKMIDEYK
jgi:hypothetical protein